jgi:hypothetical protein
MSSAHQRSVSRAAALLAGLLAALTLAACGTTLSSPPAYHSSSPHPTSPHPTTLPHPPTTTPPTTPISPSPITPTTTPPATPPATPPPLSPSAATASASALILNQAELQSLAATLPLTSDSGLPLGDPSPDTLTMPDGYVPPVPGDWSLPGAYDPADPSTDSTALSVLPPDTAGVTPFPAPINALG